MATEMQTADGREARYASAVLALRCLVHVLNFLARGLGLSWVGAVSDGFPPTHPGNALQRAFDRLVPFSPIAIALARRPGREAAR